MNAKKLYNLVLVRLSDGLVVLRANNLTAREVLTYVAQSREVYFDEPLAVEYTQA